MTVSYTHLDVYKRQVGPLSAGNGFVLFKKVTGAASGNAKDQEEEGIFHKLMEVKVDQL